MKAEPLKVCHNLACPLVELEVRTDQAHCLGCGRRLSFVTPLGDILDGLFKDKAS